MLVYNNTENIYKNKNTSAHSFIRGRAIEPTTLKKLTVGNIQFLKSIGLKVKVINNSK